MFRAPLKVDKNTSCRITVQSELAVLINQAELIIWDEAVMAHRDLYSTIDRTFRDIALISENKNKFFGNKLMLFGGDFRQVLPVVPKGNRDAILKASLKNTKFWKDVKVYKLTENMRIKSAAINQGVSESEINKFAQFLLQIGEGIFPKCLTSRYEDDIQLTSDIAKNISEEELINKVFPEIEKNYLDKDFMTSRAILAPKNIEVDYINNLCSKIFPGESKTYLSTNYVYKEKYTSKVI